MASAAEIVPLSACQSAFSIDPRSACKVGAASISMMVASDSTTRRILSTSRSAHPKNLALEGPQIVDLALDRTPITAAFLKRCAIPLGAFLLSACATPDVVGIQQVGDQGLSCDQLRAEFLEAQDFERRAEDERGATGTNILAGVFFWPALLATYSNIDDAVDAARDRQVILQNIASEKDCTI